MNSRSMRLRAQTLSLAVGILLTACGGGGSDPAPTPTPNLPTPVPETLAVTAPGSAEASAELQFGNSASGLSGLTFSWDFGDGKTSTEASPKHAFAKGGDYEIVLKVSNAAGASREQRTRVTITNLGNVKGLVCSGAGQTGWCWQQPKPTGNGRNDLALLNASTAFNVGDSGEIFKTVDAGANWTLVPSGMTSSLRAISFSSDKDGWIVGDYGALLRSSDGGATWSLTKVAELDPYGYGGPRRLQALDANTAIMTDGYNLRVTSDGGKTWSSNVSTPGFISPKGVFWTVSGYTLNKSTDFGKSTSTVLSFSENNGYLNSQSLQVYDEKVVFLNTVHYFYSTPTTSSYTKSTMRRSVDGGATWAELGTSGIDSSDLNNYSSSRVLRASAADQVILAQIGSKLYRSQDGGATWSKGTFPTSYYGYSGDFLTLGSKTLVTISGSMVYRSDDLGATWSQATIGSGSYNVSYSSLRRLDADTAVMRGTDGSAYLSSDQGKTWKQLIGPGTDQLSTYSGGGFFDGKHGFLLSRQGELSETSDGGLTWKTKLPGTQQSLGDLQLSGDKLGWLLLGDGRLSITTDAGASWGTALRVGAQGFSRIGLTDDKRGWGLYSYYGNQPSFAVTADGGKSWSDVSAPNGVYALYQGADSQLIGYGSGGTLALSADAGKTWSQRYSGTSVQLYAMASPEAGTLWVVGDQGVVRRSTDKGQTWVEVRLGETAQLNAIAFASAKVGWIAGGHGTVYATIDGGKTWTRQYTGTQRNFTRILVADTKTAWILGDGGSVLATGNGGF